MSDSKPTIGRVSAADPLDRDHSLEHPVTPSRLELHIDELVLHGFASGDRHRIGDALERELARLLADRGLPSAGASSVFLEKVDAGAFKVPPGSRAQSIGTQLAQKVHQQISLSKNEPSRRPPAKPDRIDQ